MERLDMIFKTIIAGAGAVTGYLYGGWSVLLQILLVFVIIDYLTGMVASGLKGELNSKIGFKGIIKKVMIFVVVAVAHMVDKAIGDMMVQTGEMSMLMDATIFFYIANELLSITENAGKIGIPIPEKLLNAVEVLKGKGEDK